MKRRTNQWLSRLFGGRNASLQVIIAGLPRSGTSFVSGLVHRMGFRLGPEDWLKKPDEHNPRGYYECVPLLKISERIIEKLGSDFHENLPELSPGWTDCFRKEKKEILRLVSRGRIEMYKGNRLVVIGDIYEELFPDAKWIFIERDMEETFRSRFGEPYTKEEWKEITERRLALWRRSKAASKALHMDFSEFKDDIEKAFLKLQTFLGIELSPSRRQECLAFYQPRK